MSHEKKIYSWNKCLLTLFFNSLIHEKKKILTNLKFDKKLNKIVINSHFYQ